jgi:hypothetical protein
MSVFFMFHGVVGQYNYYKGNCFFVGFREKNRADLKLHKLETQFSTCKVMHIQFIPNKFTTVIFQ